MSFRWFLRNFRLRRKRLELGDFTKLAREAGEVIAARTTKAFSGSLGAGEAHRMVAEKQAAAMEAYLAFTKYALRGQISSASTASFNVFRKAVSSNRRRLRRRARRRLVSARAMGLK
jgi:hypothetical protein